MDQLTRTIAIGVIATALMDLWGAVRHPLFGFPRLDYRALGRWVAHMPRGRFRHASIAAAPRLPGELVVGWTAHYLIGITFAAALVRVWGPAWLRQPTIGPALLVGIGSVVAPLLLMHPGMGNGVAASRAPRPAAARIQSLISHTVYALGLYAAGWATQPLSTITP